MFLLATAGLFHWCNTHQSAWNCRVILKFFIDEGEGASSILISYNLMRMMMIFGW